MSLPRRRRARRVARRTARGWRPRRRDARFGVLAPAGRAERIPSGPTGALSVLFEAEGASVSGAHVAYPSGDAVVVAETHVGFPSTFSRVALAEGEDEGSSPREREPPSCVAWAPGETRGALLVARGREIHLCAPAERDDDDETDETSAPSRSSPRSRRRADVTRGVRGEGGGCRLDERRNGVRLGRGGRAPRVARRRNRRARRRSGGAIASYGRSFLGVRTAARRRGTSANRTRRWPPARPSRRPSRRRRGARVSRASGTRGYLAQTLRHPTAVTSARWKLETPETPDAFRSRGTASISFTNTVALVTTSEDGAARVWTACGPAASERVATDAPVRLAQTVVVQTDPGPSGRPGARRRALARVAPRAAQRAA